MKKITVSILGFGQRGLVYAEAIQKYPHEVELVKVCESNTKKHPLIQTMFHLKDEDLFHDEHAFLTQKWSDILVISTMDKDHYRQVMRALDLGYDILLEKPIALVREEIIAIRDKANLLGRKIAVAHVLRYTIFYEKLKEIIDQKQIGDLVTIQQTENVGYFHYVHSYVRGNWHNSHDSSPMILAKSCHDLDIIRYLMGKNVKRLSSFGNLFYFKKENAPQGAATHCKDCKVDCPFNAVDFYRKNPRWMKLFTLDDDVDRVFQDEKLNYGKCVYHMDNNVVDHQVVNLEFEHGATASFTMTGFSNENHRSLTLHGTLGEVNADMDNYIITIKPFGKEKVLIDLRTFTNDFSHHGGGDYRLFMDFVRAVRDQKKFITDINDSVESHVLALDAEVSRLNQGQVIEIQY